VKQYVKCKLVLMLGLLVGVLMWSNGTMAQKTDAESIQKLQRLIEKQQGQLDAQEKAIEDLKNQLQNLPKAAPEQLTSTEKLPTLQAMIKPGSDKVGVQIYGQVNRGVLYADDGNDSELYHVDNDNSSTRLGINAKTRTGGDLEVGAKFEVQFESNSSSEVSQTALSAGADNFTKRHLDLFFESKRFGKLSMGQGDTASNGTSEVDLSGTSLIGYSDVETVAGGMFFFDDTANSLSATTVGRVFNNMDGLSRKDRLRYDTPSFNSFVLSVSAVEEKSEDIALQYNKTFPDFKISAAAAYANIDDTTVDDQLNGSVSVLLNNGLNATLAAGGQNMQASGRDDPTFYYAKFGYKWKHFDFGPTAASFDFGTHNDVAQNDDEANTFGLQFVQELTNWRTELYLGYRYFDLERNGIDFEDINAFFGGARIRF
jgi:hypothetical protein